MHVPMASTNPPHRKPVCQTVSPNKMPSFSTSSEHALKPSQAFSANRLMKSRRTKLLNGSSNLKTRLSELVLIHEFNQGAESFCETAHQIVRVEQVSKETMHLSNPRNSKVIGIFGVAIISNIFGCSFYGDDNTLEYSDAEATTPNPGQPPGKVAHTTCGNGRDTNESLQPSGG